MKDAKAVEVSAISVVEKNPPEGQEGIEWRLLTTLPVNSLEDAKRCIRYYSKRWVSKAYHRVLKTGCQVEALAHRNVVRVQRALAVYMVVAWRLMFLLNLGRQFPDLPADILFPDLEIEVSEDAFEKKASH